MIVIGLGNPGKEYIDTRHNVGFMVIERLAEFFGVSLKERGCRAIWGSGTISERQVVLAKPQTFVNNSGEAAYCLLDYFRVSASQLLVVHDDLDLALGKIKIKEDGGSGGHKGIDSIISVLGTREFARIRVGIGRPPGRQDPAQFVLRPFTSRQMGEIELVIPRAVEAVESIIVLGSKEVMNKYN